MNIIILSVIFLTIFMFCVWTISFWKKNPGFVDFFWSIGLMLTGLLFLSENFTGRNQILFCLLSIWALRLATHMYVDRIKNNVIEKRYIHLSDQWQLARWLAFLINFEFQGMLILIMSSIFWFSSHNPSVNLGYFDYGGIVICIIGIVGESVSDRQLRQFKKSHPGEVCQCGLWQYSRHPNLFFDWMTWCGFTAFSLSTAYGWIGLLSPLTLYVIMNVMTLPMTEKLSVESKGQQYQLFQQTTSKFFIWFKKD